MKHINELILALDIEDSKRIIKLIKDKKRKVLAITPNAYEVLRSYGFLNIISPHEINENLHQEVAEDNMKLRNKLEKIDENFSFAVLCDENFKNIFIQCFSTINFFLKFIKKEVHYLCLLDDKFKRKNQKEVINLILNTIIQKKYGIFKLGFFFNNKKLFIIKKILNDILFYIVRKKKNYF